MLILCVYRLNVFIYVYISSISLLLLMTWVDFLYFCLSVYCLEFSGLLFSHSSVYIVCDIVGIRVTVFDFVSDILMTNLILTSRNNMREMCKDSAKSKCEELHSEIR